MTNSEYIFDHGPGQRFGVLVSEQTLTIENKLIRRKVEIPYNDLKKIIVKKFFGKLKLEAQYQEGGKDKKTFFIFEPIDKQAKDVLEKLKTYVPSSQKWQNDFETPQLTNGNQSFSLGSRMAGRFTPRSGVILMWALMSLTLVGLPVFLYLLFAKGYTGKTTSDGIELKKFLPKRFAWSDIKNVHLLLTDVTIKSHGASVGKNLWCTFEVETQSGQKSKFIADCLNGAQLIKLFIQNGKMDKSFAENLAI